MSQEHIDRDRTPDQMSLDELIASAKADLNEAPPKFEAQLPPEYADLAEEETLYYEETEDDGPRVPGVIKVLLYLCCVLAAAVLLGVGAWKCADDVLALTAEEEIVTVTVPENVTMAALTEDLARSAAANSRYVVRIAAPEDQVVPVLSAIPGMLKVEVQGVMEPGTVDVLVEAEKDVDIRRALFEECAKRGWYILVITPVGVSLEDIFLQLVEQTSARSSDPLALDGDSGEKNAPSAPEEPGPASAEGNGPADNAAKEDDAQ